ncbi:uncharacterized protein LOC142351167 isoform X2 [Convolutriloba macropyga]
MADSPAGGVGTITALLKAEKEAKQVVEQARVERRQQLKRAEKEATDHIISLREQAHKEVQEANEAFRSKHADDIAAGEEDTKAALEKVDQLAEENREAVIAMLVEWCTSVEPQLHENLFPQQGSEESSQ